MGETKLDPQAVRDAIKTVATATDNRVRDKAFEVVCAYLESMIDRLSRRFFTQIEEAADFRQTILLNLFQACPVYNGVGNVKGFFYRVLSRRCFTEVKRQRQARYGGGNTPLCLNLNNPYGDYDGGGNEVTLEALVPSNDDQYARSDDREEIALVVGKLYPVLSDVERIVFFGMLTQQGKSYYADIIAMAEERFGLKLTLKQVDNAIRRIYGKRDAVLLGKAKINVYRRKRHGTFWSFGRARAFVHTLGLTSQKDWIAYCKSGERPAYIPAAPVTYYKDHWVDWPYWLGYKGKRGDKQK